MPDVKVWSSSDLVITSKEEFLDEIQHVVALHMSCWVPSDDKAINTYYRLDAAREIDIPVFDRIQGRSGSAVIVEIAAYAIEDRMRTIKHRIQSIAREVASLFGVAPDDVSITFFPVPFECWTTGALGLD